MRCQHITLKERYVIYHLRLMRLIFREIGRRSGRHPMTISREVKRNGPVRGMYWDQSVQDRAMERRKRPRHWRRSSNTSLVGYVHACLCQDWSPATFCARLTLEFPRNQRMRISAEGIYRWIYQDAAQGGALYRHLPGRHKKRRRFGHWEGDSVKGLKGLKGSSGIAAYVERKSRLLLAGKLADKRAMTLNQTAQRLFAQMPTKWKKSLTVDNGKEFALFRQIEKDTGRSVYFADPYSPWQRGTNENTNGLLRHYFPKGINWKTVSDQTLATAVDKLNNRPRKCLGYRTPLEVFIKNLGGVLPT